MTELTTLIARRGPARHDASTAGAFAAGAAWVAADALGTSACGGLEALTRCGAVPYGSMDSREDRRRGAGVEAVLVAGSTEPAEEDRLPA